MTRLILPAAWAPSLPPAAGAVARPAEPVSEAAGASFQWVMQRRAALSPRQLSAGLGLLVLMSGAVAAFFWLQGARFVTAFAGLELLAVVTAFAWHAVHAADSETVSLQAGRLLLERRHGLRSTQHVLDTDWLQVRRSPCGLIDLCAGRQHHLIGQHVDGACRRRVLAELRQALAPRRTAGRTPE